MSKTFDDGIYTVTFRADVDLTAKQYYAATAASTEDYVKVADGGSDPGPLGIIQDNNASNAGEAVGIKLAGVTKAVVAACTLSGPTCDIDLGHWLVAGSDGKLYYASCGLANARSLEMLADGTSAIINVLWLPSAACAFSAS